MENSWYSLFVGEDVMENSASPTPGTQSIAHWPGICSNSLVPSGRTIRNVFTSGVSRRISVMIPTCGSKAFFFSSLPQLQLHIYLVPPMRLMTFTIFSDCGHFSTQRPHPTQEYIPSLLSGK